MPYRGSASPSEFLSEPSEADSNGSALTSIFLARDNPRQFFVREPLPSTAASTRSSPAAASGAPPSPSSKAGPSRKAPGERSAGAGEMLEILNRYICPKCLIILG